MLRAQTLTHNVQWRKMKRIYLLLTLILTAMSSTHAELSKDEIKSIAKQYAEAFKNGDFKAWKNL